MHILPPAAARVVLLVLAAAACGDSAREAPGADVGADTTAAPTATAVIRDSVGRELGTLTLTSAEEGITVLGSLSGLPQGEYAMHLHNAGSCEPPAFESAGDHWNPTNAQHGSHAEGGPHLGDLRNVTAGQDSVAEVRVVTAGGQLRNEPALLDADGAAIVLHAGPDDYESQPSGNSGPPIACGVVEG